MKIALVGYGKVGHMIESIAKKRGNEVVLTVDPFAPDATLKTSDSAEIAAAVKASGAEGVIEFTHPTSVMGNITALVPAGVPVVVGTTGWLGELDNVAALVKEYNNALFYAANFSVGVNLFYKVVAEAAKLIGEYDEYDVATWEAHHNQKADSPSGTALEIARQILDNMSSKTEMVTDSFYQKPQPHQLHVSSTRVGSVPGTHTVFFDSPADTIELTHTARSREGFALGAVRACEWLAAGIADGSIAKGSLYTMSDLIK